MTRWIVLVAAGAVAVAAAHRLSRAGQGTRARFAPVVSINRDAAYVRERSGLHGVEVVEEQGGAVVHGKSDDGPSWRKLREIRQLLETGEVLRVEGQPHGRRKPLGAALERAGRAAKERAR